MLVEHLFHTGEENIFVPAIVENPFLFNVELPVLFHALWDLPIVALLSHNFGSDLFPVSELKAGTYDAVHTSPDLILRPLTVC